MALPTAQTPGYTTYSGKVSCVCLAAWLPWLERLCLAHGFIRYRLDVLQLTGTYSLSGGTHAGGGVYDIKQYDTRIVALAREMGAPATWMRNMLYADGSPGNTHTHGVLSGCPHNSQARYQITAQARGYNGMGKGTVSPYIGVWGYGGKDPHPDPKVYRTWSQGITWAKAEIARVTGQNLIDNLETIMALSDADKVWLTALVEKRPWFYKNPDTTRDAYDYLRNPGLDVWDENFVTRDGEQVSMKQEIADTKTQAIATAGALAALSAKVDTLKDGVANLVTLIQESHPKAEPAKVPATQYGVDVSGHQTLEQVKAAAANPKYGFAIVKATEGKTYDSAAYAAQMAAVRGAGLCASAYHFAWPNQDAATEAAHFVGTAALKPGELACLDVENWDAAHPDTMTNTPWSTRVAYTLAWLREVKRLTGATPLVYANWDWIKGLRTAATVEQWDELVTYPLWIAQYRAAGTFDTVSPKTGSANGWPVVMHQWTNNDGGLDGDYMPDPAAWAKYALP